MSELLYYLTELLGQHALDRPRLADDVTVYLQKGQLSVGRAYPVDSTEIN